MNDDLSDSPADSSSGFQPSPASFWDRSTWDPNTLGAAAFGEPTAPYRPPAQVAADVMNAVLTGPSHAGWAEPITRMGIDQIMAAMPSGQQPVGIFTGAMRQLTADGHPALQSWANGAAASQGYPLSALWALNSSTGPSTGTVQDAQASSSVPPPATISSDTSSPTTPMALSERGADFMKSYEMKPGQGSFYATPYASLEGGADTVGWGHKIKAGEVFSKTKPLSSDDADGLFRNDVQSSEALVRNSVGQQVTQPQFDALVSLAYNYPKAFKNGDFLESLKTGDFDDVADQMESFSAAHKDGKVIHPRGLAQRRSAEADIFRNGHYFNNH